jgi:hypothetical protein
LVRALLAVVNDDSYETNPFFHTSSFLKASYQFTVTSCQLIRVIK